MGSSDPDNSTFRLAPTDLQKLFDGDMDFPASMFSLKGNDRIVGNKFTDYLVGADGNDQISGNNGKDHLWGGRGNDWVMGGSGSDRVFGDAGNDSLSGDAGADKLYGGSGRDEIIGGKGSDHLWGNGGTDTFGFSRGDGNDRIFDFNANHDLIQIFSGARRFRDLDISRDGSDTVIEFADVSIRLEDVRPAELDADNFVF